MTLALASLSHTRQRGWNEPFPELDSESTLVLAFGGRCYEEDERPLRELRSAFSRSVLLGCELHNQTMTLAVIQEGP